MFKTCQIMLMLLCCMLLKGVDVNYGRAGSFIKAPVIEWQDAYVLNHTDIDIEITADVTHFSTLIDLQNPEVRIERVVWFVPKKEGKFPGVSTLGKLNLLHNIAVKAKVYDLSLMPTWLQKPYPIEIKSRIPEKVLLLTIKKDDYGWKMQQDYVMAVKMVAEGPSGYHIEVVQF